MATFERTRRIHFSQCDPAGIVFYPQYLIMLNDLIEDWLREALDYDLAVDHLAKGWGLPTVHLECDFRAPTFQGETLGMRLELERIGNASIRLAVRCSSAGTERFQATLTLVVQDLSTGRAAPIPPKLREGLTRFSGATSAGTDEALKP